MANNPDGKLNLDQLKQLTRVLVETRSAIPELEQTLRTKKSKIKAILGGQISWVHFYEMPFEQHMACSLFVLDWQDEIKKAARSDDPYRYFFEFADYLYYHDDGEWSGGYQGQFQKHHLVEVVISLLRTMKSIMVYQKSLSTLVAEAGQNHDKALFDAIRIDRTIINCGVAKQRLSLAEMTNDKKFYQHLAKALKGPDRKHWAGLETMRYVMKALVDTGSDQLKGENIEQLFVDHLKLYPQTAGAQKNLLKHFLAAKKSTT